MTTVKATRTAKKTNRFGQLCMCITLFFFYISFRPSLRDYVVKLPHFTFHGGRKHMATIFSIYLQT